ncbi:RING finger protein [Musa troglodytarum]|uniref:RING finger protein n=1 Tax=Musa troglodytarum TaxID=320322 RepID=A0A9E7GU99_9LILI|nr:RING finger protein [Musa troglodytarum]
MKNLCGTRERQEPEASRVLENIEKYNRNFGGGSSSLIQRLRDLPFFIRRLLREMMDPQRSLPIVLRVRVILAMALTAIYVLSPVDIIPEGVFGFVGFLDDLIILLIVFLHLATVYRSVLLYRHGDGRHRWMVKERSVSPQVSSLIAQEIH